MNSKYLILALTACCTVFISCSQNESGIEKTTAIDIAPNSTASSLYQVKDEALKSQTEYGAYLVTGPASCGFCHGDGTSQGTLSGGRYVHTPEGNIFSPSLVDNDQLQSWSEKQLVSVIREGKREGDTDLHPVVHAGFRWLSDNDVRAIVHYLKPQEKNRSLSPLKDLEPRGVFSSSFEGTDSSFVDYVPVIPRSTSVQYGRYLALHVARCQVCHSPDVTSLDDEIIFSGSKDNDSGFFSSLTSIFSDSKSKRSNSNRDGEVIFAGIGPNIRGRDKAGLADWSQADIVSYLSTGETPGDSNVDPADCPWTFYQHMTTEDKTAIARYLKTL
jgi:mono/diheme cytochrome c family protein